MATLLAAAGAIAVALSCSAPGRGAVILAITTDMQAPQDIDIVSVFISTGSSTDFDFLGRVPPVGTTLLPATLAVVEPENPNAQVRIRVIGFKDQNARVLRDVLTTVPPQQTVLLRVPLDFLDDGSGQGTIPAALVPLGSGGAPEGDSTFDAIDIASSCDFDNQQTMINGECTSAVVDVGTLTPYDPAQVYGAGGVQADGLPVQCFDAAGCFLGATPVTDLDMTQCSFPLPVGAAANLVNVALVTTDTGECNASGQCFVPLENDLTQGWTVSGSTVQMIAGICKKVAGGAQLFVSSGACPSKSISDPVCEPGEVVPGGGVGTGGNEPDGTIAAADGGSTGTPLGGGDAATAAAPNPHGTVVLPNGALGVAVVHIEDATGALMATPSVQNIAAMGDVLLVAEPSDLSQGVVATTQALQTLNTATTAPSLTDDIPLSYIADGGPIGVPTSVSVFADSTFSAVQMSHVYGSFFTCFTGGLHLAQNQDIIASSSEVSALNASPDGTLIATTFTTGAMGFSDVVTMLSPHEIYYSSTFSFQGLPPSTVTGRGAMAYDPTTSDTMLYAGPDGNVYAFSTLKETGAKSSVALPGTPAGASIAYAPSGKYAIVATSAGLFTVTVGGDAGMPSVGDAGTPSVVNGPVDPSYTGSDGNVYTLSGAQSIAITSDGQYLVVLTDQPSPTSGTLLAMPVDANGNVGTIGMTHGGFLATAGADVISVY